MNASMIQPQPTFSVVGSDFIRNYVAENVENLVEIVRATYLAHRRGSTVNPDSYFLRFPDQPTARIIALPAALGEQSPIAGIKWISSYPSNHERDLQRASAVLILNDYNTGYPFACLEGSIISAARTAASAVVAAEQLHPSPKQIRRLGVVGAGPIARMTCEFLLRIGWQIGEMRVHDLNAERGKSLVDHMKAAWTLTAEFEPDNAAMIAGSDLVLFATTAPTPYLGNPGLFEHNPTVLHVSLRDLSPEIVLSCQNVVDDIEHCLKANTSVHLTEQSVRHRNFIAGTLADILAGVLRPDLDRPRLFSPFGLGVLDLAVGAAIYQASVGDKMDRLVPGFFPRTLDFAGSSN
ncbi:2,3-diaminopropionate biosynthesis protein SbnB [Bradyrhizobium huanghuaihaiense]|uniref:Ornithine cyclodeaminase n=1 Tax=Bradyrhizobium huanghuaihaiense TaxID=990078 RepID=A0A562R3Z7_9BRAD|nr:2,3-diaminopropionate biosynthesis protein SbnB [Bradyrhizobium huanghuaihaiense]TWI63795.1 ornithine cyclodeaminase [Bradyrhizobium huanghuaihaiense]